MKDHKESWEKRFDEKFWGGLEFPESGVDTSKDLKDLIRQELSRVREEDIKVLEDMKEGGCMGHSEYNPRCGYCEEIEPIIVEAIEKIKSLTTIE